MPPSRQLKLILIGVALFVAVYFYYSDNSSDPFYDRTLTALRQQQGRENVEGHEMPDSTVTTGGEKNPVLQGDAQKGYNNEATAHQNIEVEARQAGETDSGSASVLVTQTESQTVQHDVQQQFKEISAKAPIVIFSKSYCPYSTKAKRILLDDYDISPPPYVVELDLVSHGKELQDLVHKLTGRRTVPNVVINGKSIGGGDDVEEANVSGTLRNLLIDIGGASITDVHKRPSK